MDNNGKVYALKAKTGALLWSYTTGMGNWTQHSQVVVNGVVYFGSNDDKLYALNASTGALLWSYTTEGNVADVPPVANGMLYIGANDHKVYAFSLPPVMQASPTTLAFTAQAGGPNPLGQTVTLANTGGSAITWTGCSSQPWLTLAPTSGGIAAGTNSPLTVNVNDSGLVAGTYSGDVVLVPSVGPAVSIVVRFTLT